MIRARIVAVVCSVLALSAGIRAQTTLAPVQRIAHANLPIHFEPASGSGPVAMVSRVSGGTVAFQTSLVVIAFPNADGPDLQIDFPGSQPSQPSGVDLLPSQTNYLLGKDAARWRTHVPNYRQARYPNLYQGIDAVFYGHGPQLEHDFVIAPGADYRQIRMHLNRGKPTLMADGSLSVALPSGIVQFRRPAMYQQQHGRHLVKQGSFQLLQNDEISFTVEDYDATLPLVIDPVLDFATYLSQGAYAAVSIATDAAGNNYITGYGSVSYPVTAGSVPCTTCNANQIVTFISKLSPDGATLLYSTIIGGDNAAQPTGIAIDSNNNVLVSGYTSATDFPTKNGQTILTPNGNSLGFLLSLSSEGSALNFSTLLGPGPNATQTTSTYATAVAVDGTGSSYVTGETGAGFPVTVGALSQGGNSGAQANVYVAKFNPGGTLLYSAVIGDADQNAAGGDTAGAFNLAVDANGSAYVAGEAGSLWPISNGAYLQQIASPRATNPFVAKVAPDGKSLVYSTYLDPALVTGLSVLADGTVFVAGNYVAPNHPTTPNAYQKGSVSGGESFLTELNATGSGLVYATSFGDSTYSTFGMAIDPGNQNIWLAAQTANFAFPLVAPLQSTIPGEFGFLGPISAISQFDPTGQTLQFSTFLGGDATGKASTITIDTQHRAHIAGASTVGMYTTPGVYTPQIAAAQPGSTETFPYAALIDTTVAASALCLSPNYRYDFAPVPLGAFQDFSYTVTNCGTLPLTVTGATTSAAVFSVPAASNHCTQVVPVGQSCTLTVRYSPVAVRIDTATLALSSNASIPEAVLEITGSGAVPVITPPYLQSFGYTLLGQTSTQIGLISNTGQAPLIIDPAKTTATGDFSLDLGTCSTPTKMSCTINVSFTPTAAGTRTGTLTITSNDPANSVVTVPLVATGYTGAPVPEVTSVISQLVQANAVQTNFLVFGFGFMPNAVVEINGVPLPTNYESGSQLTVNIPAASLPSTYAELPLTVFNPTPGGGTSAPFTLTTFQVLSQAHAFLVAQADGKRLFASVPAADTAHPNTIAVIDPATVTITNYLPVGNDPGVLALSPDQKYLYVALNGDHAIQRIVLASGAIDRTFSLPMDPEFGQTTVFDMHVPPTVSTELVASLQLPEVSPGEDGIALFDDSGLVQWIPGTSAPNSLPVDRFTFTSSPTSLYALPPQNGGIDEISYASTGLSYTGTTCCAGGPSAGLHLVSDGTLLYTDSGVVWDPVANLVAKTFPVASDASIDSIVPDGAATGKTYFLNTFAMFAGYEATSVEAFDQSTAALTGSLSISSSNPLGASSGTQLVRWGANGFAYRAVNDSATTLPTPDIFLFTSSMASGVNLNPAPVATTLLPATVAAGTDDFALTVTGSGFVSGSTVEWNGTPRVTTVVSATRISATIYASDIANPGTGQVIVLSPGPGGGASAPVTLTIGPAQPLPTVTLLPASLTFAAQAVGTASAPQTVVVTNTGQVILSNVMVGIAGTDAVAYNQTTTCGSTLAPGATCNIAVTFAPTAAGSPVATLTVTDNAPGSPQSVTLTGSAPQNPFSVAPVASGGASTTIAAGQPANYGLMVSGSAGYAGILSFSCENLPAHASCVFLPASLTLGPGKEATVTVTIATTQPATSHMRIDQLPLGLAALLLLPWLRRSRRSGIWIGSLLLFSVVAGLGMTACSGSGSPGTTNPSPATVAPGTYSVQLVASDGTNKQSEILTLIVH